MHYLDGMEQRLGGQRSLHLVKTVVGTAVAAGLSSWWETLKLYACQPVGRLLGPSFGRIPRRKGRLSQLNGSTGNVIALYKHTTAPFIDLDDVCGKV